MSATCGLFSPSSSASAALQRSLGNKLSRRFATAGSMEYSLTLNNLVTPAQRDVFRLRALARPTSGSGCTGWPSPQVHDTTTRGNTEADHHHFPHDLSNAAELAGWPTPNVPNGGRQAAPDSMNSTGQTPEGGKRQVDLGFVASLAGWATPRLEDGESAGMRHNRGVADTLSAQVGQDLAGWATPTLNDIKNPNPRTLRRGASANDNLSRQSIALAALGPTASSSPAATGKCGVLAGAFALWLQGFPATWQHSCPGWKSWDTIQRLLAESSEKPDDTE